MSTTEWRLADLTQIRGLVHERNALAADLAALQHAAHTLHDTVNRYLAGQVNLNALRHAQEQLASRMTE